MKSITISCDDPDFWPTVDFLRQRRAAPIEQPRAQQIAGQTPLPTETNQAMLALAAVEALVQRLGEGSKKFLATVMNHCGETGTQTFTMRDIASRMDVTEKHVRANQRNVMKSAGALNIKLWEKEWDFSNRRQVFTISRHYLDAFQALL